MRGCDPSNVKEDPYSYIHHESIAAWMAEMHMTFHRHTQVSAMSPGLRRQLIILLSLLGSPKVIEHCNCNQPVLKVAPLSNKADAI